MLAYALVVEPDQARAVRMTRVLAELGYDVHPARDGEEALALLARKGPPAVLVTELSLARVTGFLVLRRLREAPGGGATRVIVRSAFAILRETAEQMRDVLSIEAILGADAPEEELARLLADAPLAPSSRRARAVRPGMFSLAALDKVTDPKRLASIARSGVLEDVSKDAMLEAIARRVALAFGVPISLVSLVLADRQWFKIRVGLEGAEPPVEVSFCTHVVRAGEALIVPDATLDPAFASNPLVRGGVVRGYAGAPLVGSDGAVWGSLCIIDSFAPLRLGPDDLDELVEAAREAVRTIETFVGRPVATAP